MNDIKINPIGEIQEAENGFAIKLKDEYKEALTGIDGFSHLHILWWADELDDADFRKITTVDKPYKVGPEKLGIFATRSPLRPNPICMTVISITEIDYENGILYTPYIDANPNTQVLDIKAYFPCSDVVKDHYMPKWAQTFPKSIEESAEFDWSTIFNFDY
ncbi:MAG: SAM-dependent methyltransferase [Clostridiales bacterium]|nr:SAM-dependent methyltransferase [Clostridiales bacterium]